MTTINTGTKLHFYWDFLAFTAAKILTVVSWVMTPYRITEGCPTFWRIGQYVPPKYWTNLPYNTWFITQKNVIFAETMEFVRCLCPSLIPNSPAYLKRQFMVLLKYRCSDIKLKLVNKSTRSLASGMVCSFHFHNKDLKKVSDSFLTHNTEETLYRYHQHMAWNYKSKLHSVPASGLPFNLLTAKLVQLQNNVLCFMTFLSGWLFYKV